LTIARENIHVENHRRMKIHIRTPRIFLIVIGIAMTAATVLATEPPSLPFSVTVTRENFDNPPDYMGPKNPNYMDYPYDPVLIDGEYWIFYKNGYKGTGGDTVYRYKGTNIENAVRQPDGVASFPIRAGYILGGIWYDADTKTLYAPLHDEEAPYGQNVERRIHLASSTDKGLTWKYEGLLVSRDDPENPRHPTDYSGLSWDGGDGDFHLFVDKRGGYIYLYSLNWINPKLGSPAMPFMAYRVARCAIADKMAPGKWWRFYNGAWNEPGVGGKASYVNAYEVSYNSYLHKYIAFNYVSGISTCDDLSKQDWTPSYHLGNYWGTSYDNLEYWATNEDKNDVYNTGQTIFLYSFMRKNPGAKYRISLGSGETGAAQGLVSPSIFWLLGGVYFQNGAQFDDTVSMDPSQQYAYTPMFESADPIDARRTRRVGCLGAEMKYGGTWSDASNPYYCEGKAKSSSENGASVEFSFMGKDVYWRAAKGPALGKADVYLDGVLQTTVDCWAVNPSFFQFAFIKQGLSDSSHTIKVVVRGEKNALSTGTAIQHMSFEYSAESYRASDCFTEIQGKNQWSYLGSESSAPAENLVFKDPEWTGADGCKISYFHMIPGGANAIRRWKAPHPGLVRIEGTATSTGKDDAGVQVSVLVNGKEALPQHLLKAGQQATADLQYKVTAGDQVDFVVSQGGGATTGGSADWDPVVTYVQE
jgi:hypothetical protein